MAEKFIKAIGREIRYFEYKLRQRKSKRKKEKQNRLSMHLHHRDNPSQLNKGYQTTKPLVQSDSINNRPDQQINAKVI